MAKKEKIINRSFYMGEDTYDNWVSITPYGINFGKYIPKKHNIPDKWIFNKDTTILIWQDKSKTIVKRSKDDKDDKLIAFLTAYFQKNSGMSKKEANNYLDKIKELN